MFVLDTNTVAYFLCGEGRVAAHLLATPPRPVAILPFDDAAARRAAALRADLERLGQPIGPLDTLIAGTVLFSHALFDYSISPHFQVI